MSKSSSPQRLLPESFIESSEATIPLRGLQGNHFGELADHFAEFCALAACLADTMPAGEQADAAWQVASGLDTWASFMDDAREAAARAPETDLLLARTWGARLADIVRDARHALRLDALAAGEAGEAGSPAAAPVDIAGTAGPVAGSHRLGSIAVHETPLPLPRLAKSPAQPVARPAGHRSSRLRRRRR